MRNEKLEHLARGACEALFKRQPRGHGVSDHKMHPVGRYEYQEDTIIITC